METVGGVEEFFAWLCWEADKALGKPGAIRFFLNWFDETERGEMLRVLLAEVQLALAERLGQVSSASVDSGWLRP